MKLSIGMIVKNEEKYLDRCLAAIMPILEKVDSELIIADTGSTDKTVEIAKKYTDKVLYFEWVNDFAAARNFTLEQSAGEWFMFLDADEIFSSCDEIISFFNSGEYKKYNTATYIQRNYTDNDMQYYSDFNAPRMTKLTPEIRFIHPVHEAIHPFRAPVKLLKDAADHYGYIYTDEKLRTEKYKRNSELLMKRLEQEEDPEPLLYLQIYQSLNLCDTEKALIYLEKGIEECTRKKDTVLIPLYAEKAIGLFRNKKWDETLAVCEEYFKIPSDIRPGTVSTDTEIYAIKAMALDNLHRNAEALEDYIRFFKLYRDVTNGRLKTPDMMIFAFNIAVPKNYEPMLYNFIKICISEKRFNTAAQHLNYVPIPQYYKDHALVQDRLEQEFIIMRNTNFKRAEALQAQLDDFGRNYLQAFVRREINYFSNKEELINVFKKVYKNDEGFSLLLDVYYAHYISGDSKDAILKMIDKNLAEYYELLYFMLLEKQNISPLSRQSNFDIKAAVIYCKDNYSDTLNVIEAYSPNNTSDSTGLKILLTVYETAMLIALERKRNIEKLFALWGRTGAKLKQNENSSEPYIAAAAMADIICSSRKKNDYRSCLNAMLELIRTYPQAKPYIMEIKAIVEKERQAELQKSNQTEMSILVRNIKASIKKLISAGDLKQAGNVLAEYEKINPSDPDIADLKKAVQKYCQ
ncbi:MAG: glycosyltransferase family 2 protein [Huintestinicola sp.]